MSSRKMSTRSSGVVARVDSEESGGGSDDDNEDFVTDGSDVESPIQSVPAAQSKRETFKIVVPTTPSPSKSTRGTKRGVKQFGDSDTESVFVPSPTTDSPKKPRTDSPGKGKVPALSVENTSEPSGDEGDIDNSLDDELIMTSPRRKGMTREEIGSVLPAKGVFSRSVIDPLIVKPKSFNRRSDHQTKGIVKPIHISDDVFQTSPSKSGLKSVNRGVVKGPSTSRVKHALTERQTVKDDEGEKSDSLSVYEKDLDPVTVVPKLVKCQVYQDFLVDPMLKSSYRKLVNLPGGKQNISWKPDHHNPGMFMLSKYAQVNPKADLKLAKAFILFQQDIKYINLSRANPAELLAKPRMTGLPVLTIHRRTGEHPPATCVSVIVVAESYIESPKLVGAKYCKIITGVFHSLEYERMVSAICLIYGKEFYHSQILGNATSFSTRSGDYNGRPSYSAVKKAGLYSGFPSPASKPKFSSFATSLDVNDIVPVFDARGKKPFNLPTDIQGISDILPTFHGEPPEESIVQVGYTVNSYKGSKNPEDLNISLNLLFVIILATDGKTIPHYCMENFFHDDNLFVMMGATMEQTE